jgi:hypothetical protein
LELNDQSKWKAKASELNLRFDRLRHMPFENMELPSHCFIYRNSRCNPKNAETNIIWFDNKSDLIGFVKNELPLLYISRHTSFDLMDNLSQFSTDLEFYFLHSLKSFENAVRNYYNQLDSLDNHIDSHTLMLALKNCFTNNAWFRFSKWEILYLGKVPLMKNVKELNMLKLPTLFSNPDTHFHITPLFLNNLSLFLRIQSVSQEINEVVKGLRKLVLESAPSQVNRPLDYQDMTHAFSEGVKVAEKGIDCLLNMSKEVEHPYIKNFVTQLIAKNKMELGKSISHYETLLHIKIN